MNKLEAQFEDAVDKRRLAIQVMLLCVGGTIGLLFTPVSLLKVGLIVLGGYLSIRFLSNYRFFDDKVEELTEKMED